jgi:hypothetical protein
MFPDCVDNEINNNNKHRCEATQRVMAAKLTTLTHEIAIKLQLVTESCTICSFRSRRSVRRLLDTPSYVVWGGGGLSPWHGESWVADGQEDLQIVTVAAKVNWAPLHKGVLGSGGIAPRILNLGTKWRWVVSIPRERAPGAHFIGGWVGPRSDLDTKNAVADSR